MKNLIYPCLWFDNQAKEAAEFYCRIFPNSRIIFESPMVVQFELNRHRFMGLNGGPQFKHSEAVSFVIECKDQQEIDHYWNNLIADGGQESMCGWCKDKFGVSWQVVPTVLGVLMRDPEKSKKVFEVVMTMRKLDVQTILNA
ncbi:VOC family protein [Confluentibacter lentus]|uniref:VOC family protein n=1 Tax=Confluentibacter lentus TaxID=1699412 RepID=UPI000C283308|nr:VOC family protein [Confluentibacter lentus]